MKILMSASSLKKLHFLTRILFKSQAFDFFHQMEEKKVHTNELPPSTTNPESNQNSENPANPQPPLIINEIYDQFKLFYQEQNLERAKQIIEVNFSDDRLNDVFTAIQMILLNNLNQIDNFNYIDFKFLFDCLSPNLCQFEKAILIFQKRGFFSFFLRLFVQQEQQISNRNKQSQNHILSSIVVLLSFFKEIHLKAPRFLSLLTLQDYDLIAQLFNGIKITKEIFELMLSILLRRETIDANFYAEIEQNVNLSIENIIKSSQNIKQPPLGIAKSPISSLNNDGEYDATFLKSLPLHSTMITNSHLLRILYLNVYQTSSIFYENLEKLLIVLNLHFEYNRYVCYSLLPFLFQMYPGSSKLLSYICASYIPKDNFEYLISQIPEAPSSTVQFLANLIHHTSAHSKNAFFMLQRLATGFLEIKEFRVKTYFSMKFQVKFLSPENPLHHTFHIISKEYLEIHIIFSTIQCSVRIKGRNLANEEEFSTIYTYSEGEIGINLYEWTEFNVIYTTSFIRIIINQLIKFDIPIPEREDFVHENKYIKAILAKSFNEISEISICTYEKVPADFLSFIISPSYIDKNDSFSTIDTKIFRFSGIAVKGAPTLSECFLSCGGLDILYTLMRNFDGTTQYLSNLLKIIQFVIKTNESLFTNSQFFRSFGHFICSLDYKLISIELFASLLQLMPQKQDNQESYISNILLNFAFLSRCPEPVLSNVLQTQYVNYINPICSACSFRDVLLNFLSFSSSYDVIKSLWILLNIWAHYSIDIADSLSIIAAIESSTQKDVCELHIKGLNELMKLNRFSSFFNDNQYLLALLKLLSMKSEELRIKCMLIIMTYLPKQILSNENHFTTAIQYLTSAETSSELTTMNLFNCLFINNEISLITAFNFDTINLTFSLPQLLPIFAISLDNSNEPSKYTTYLGNALLRCSPLQFDMFRSCDNWVFWFLFFLKIDNNIDIWRKVLALTLGRFIHDDLMIVYTHILLILTHLLNITPKDFSLSVMIDLLNFSVEGQDKIIVAFRIIVSCLYVPKLEKDINNTNNKKVLDQMKNAKKLSEIANCLSQFQTEDVVFNFLFNIRQNQKVLFKTLSVLLNIQSGIDVLFKFDTINIEFNSLKISSFLITKLYEVNPINALILLRSFLKLIQNTAAKSDSQNIRTSLLILVNTFQNHHVFCRALTNELSELFQENLTNLEKTCQEVLNDNNLNLRFNMLQFEAQFNTSYKQYIESLTNFFENIHDPPKQPELLTKLNFINCKSDQLFYKSVVKYLLNRTIKIHRVEKSKKFQFINHRKRMILKRSSCNSQQPPASELHLYLSDSQFRCIYVRLHSKIEGILTYLNHYLIFIGKHGKVIEIPNSKIEFALSRNNLRIEFFLTNQSSFLFHFNDVTSYFRFLDILRNKCSFFQKFKTFEGPEYFKIQRFTQQWEEGQISNFDYLLWINICSGRTFHDLSSYPLFPYVIATFNDNELQFNKCDSFRNFETDQSTGDLLLPSNICSTLIDIYPFFTFPINKLDFLSSLQTSNSVPLETYTTPLAFVHSNLPKWASFSPNLFVMTNKRALEMPYVSLYLYMWIDRVFGVNQNSSKERNQVLTDFDCITPPNKLFTEKHPQPTFNSGSNKFGMNLIPHTKIENEILNLSTNGSKLYILLSDGHLTVSDILGRRIEKTMNLKLLNNWEIDLNKCFILAEGETILFVPKNANYFIHTTFSEIKIPYLVPTSKQTAPIKAIVTDESKIVASVSEDNSIVIYNLESNNVMSVINDHKGEVTSCSLHTKLGIIVSTSIECEMNQESETDENYSTLIVISKIENGRAILKEKIGRKNSSESKPIDSNLINNSLISTIDEDSKSFLSNADEDTTYSTTDNIIDAQPSIVDVKMSFLSDLRIKKTIITNSGFIIFMFQHRIELRDMSLKLVNACQFDSDEICLIELFNEMSYIAASNANRIFVFRLCDFQEMCVIDIPEYKPKKMLFSEETKKFICVVSPPSTSSVFISDILT